MARKPRVVVAGMPLHVIQRGNNRQAVFFADEDYQRYLDDLYDASIQQNCQIHAYVLMTNHVHLLLTPLEQISVSRMMQALGRRYVRYVNKVYQRTGSLWEGRFKSALIDSEHYYFACSRYIELNPVRASLVTHPSDYPWSSFNPNAYGEKSNLIQYHDCYQSLGMNQQQRCSAYFGLFDQHLDSQYAKNIRDATNTNDLVGNDRFREQIEAMLDRKLYLYKHGGDRKSSNFKYALSK